MNSIMTLLKPLNNPNLLLPYEQYYIQTLHHKSKLIPEQNPVEANPLFQTAINRHIPHKQNSNASACIRIMLVLSTVEYNYLLVDVCCLLHKYQLHVSALMTIFKLMN